MRALIEDMDAAPEQRLRGSLRSWFGLRLGADVGHLSMPVILMGGDQDAVVPLTDMLETWGMYPADTGLHIRHGQGHSPNLDAPAQFAEVLGHFVKVGIPAQLSPQS